MVNKLQKKIWAKKIRKFTSQKLNLDFSRKLFVENILRHCKAKKVEEIFEDFGVILETRIVKDLSDRAVLITFNISDSVLGWCKISPVCPDLITLSSVIDVDELSAVKSKVRYIPLQATAGASDQAGAADNDGDDQLLALPSLRSR
ncbi:hypothetical protein DAPPUDRAFT_115247 [Daphnia pulex]|uniref:RRM domain-containing protein n=1 Tax=Daphnia pulex TaxID=6669 RepID=E9HKR2_DAPPU|nr:hypothetical protein DAPPUDRAFT_115247 [Daphnia pulex]|eukprot:EFX67671.1 hypothetical protein DAPPUDRAFT_115247 [Daphnia pulex]